MTNTTVTAQNQSPNGFFGSLSKLLPSNRALRTFVFGIAAAATPLVLYFFFYVGNQQQYLLDRNLRALNSTAQEFTARVNLLPHIIRFNRRDTKSPVNGQKTPNSSTVGTDQTQVRFFDNQLRTTSAADFKRNNPWLRRAVQSAHTSVNNCVEDRASSLKISNGKPTLIAKNCWDHSDKDGIKSIVNTVTVPLADLVPKQPNQAVFDGIIVISDDAKIQYASAGLEWITADLEGKIFSPDEVKKNKNSSFLPALPTQKLGQTDYVSQRVSLRNINMEGSFTLIGITTEQRFRQHLYKISPKYWLIILSVSLILLCAIPFLKTRFAGEIQSVRHRDIFLMGAGLLVAMAIVTILTLDVLAFQGVARELEKKTQNTADALNNRFSKEIQLWIDKINLEVKNGWPASSPGTFCGLNGQPYTHEKCPPKQLQQVSELDRLETLFALNQDGWVTGTEKTARKNPFPTRYDLSTRSYFQQVMNGETVCIDPTKNIQNRSRAEKNNSTENKNNRWAINHNRCSNKQFPAIIERVRTADQGLNLTLISFPLEKTDSTGKTQLVGVAAGRFLSLFGTVLHQPLSYAVIDSHSGDVIFHSDESRSLVEKFYEEIQHHELLEGAARSGKDWEGRVSYHGATHYTVLRKMHYPNWSLVVMFDTKIADALNFDTTAMTFLALLMSIIGLTTVFWVANKAIKAHLPQRRSIWVWPDTFGGHPAAATSLYQIITTVSVALIALQSLAIHHRADEPGYGWVLSIAILGWLLTASLITALQHSIDREARVSVSNKNPIYVSDQNQKNQFSALIQPTNKWLKLCEDKQNSVRWILWLSIVLSVCLIARLATHSWSLTLLFVFITPFILAPTPPFLALRLSPINRLRRAYVGCVTAMLVLIIVMPSAALFSESKKMALDAFRHYQKQQFAQDDQSRNASITRDWTQRVNAQNWVEHRSRYSDSDSYSRPNSPQRSWCEQITASSPLDILICYLPKVDPAATAIWLNLPVARNDQGGKQDALSATAQLKGDKDKVQWGIFTLLLSVAVISLKRFLARTAEHVFAMDAQEMIPEKNYANARHLISKPKKAFDENHLLIRPPRTFINKLIKLTNGPKSVFELRDMATPLHIGDAVPTWEPPDPDCEGILLVNFECNLHDPDYWQGKLDWIHKFLILQNDGQNNPHIVIVSELDFLPRLTGTYGGQGAILSQTNRQRASQLISRCWKTRFDSVIDDSSTDTEAWIRQVMLKLIFIDPSRLLQESQQIEPLIEELRTALKDSHCPANDIQNIKQQIINRLDNALELQSDVIDKAQMQRSLNLAADSWHECKWDTVTREIWFNFITDLNRLEDSLKNTQSHPRSVLILNSFKSVTELVRDRADARFRYLWALCSPQERHLLYQLANGEICNPRNRDVLIHLMHRDFIIYRQSYQLSSEAFGRFVLDVVNDDMIQEWDRVSADNVWTQLRWPVLAFVLALFAVVFWMRGSSVESLGQVLVLIATLLPALGLGSGGTTGGTPEIS
ncbi:MAG: hypothetical protein JKY89_04310 [Immundisolibacteraceae bacterium]|nr:hypothetical protein [Immundisolibacteraceae bacterium]